MARRRAHAPTGNARLRTAARGVRSATRRPSRAPAVRGRRGAGGRPARHRRRRVPHGRRRPRHVHAGRRDSRRPLGSPSVDQGDGKGPGGGTDTYDPNAGIRPGESRVWLRDNQTEVAGSGTWQYGPWRVGDVVVKAISNEFTAYAVADGQEKWNAPLPTAMCGVPPTPSANGKLVVGVKESASEKARCTGLQLIDLTTGKAGWKTAVTPENQYDTALEFEMAIAGDTVAVARSAVISGFSVTDGRKLFGTWNANGCYPSAFAGGSRLVVIRHCPDPNDARGPAGRWSRNWIRPRAAPSGATSTNRTGPSAGCSPWIRW